MEYDKNPLDPNKSSSIEDKQKRTEARRIEPLKYGKSSQSPMAENVGDIDLNEGAGDDTEMQSGHQFEEVKPKNRKAADINGVTWEGE